jgi:hypothetical protein
MTISPILSLGVCAALSLSLGAIPAQSAYAADSPPAQTSSDVAPAAPEQPVVPAEPQEPVTQVVPAAPSKPEAKTTRKRKAAVLVASVSTGPSRWRGPVLHHPSGRRFPPAVIRWANLVAAVMAEKRIPRRYLPGILAQIQQESSGNPYAVNNWDINAARGTPSKGLLQVIAPTYRAHAKPGYRSIRFQTVPYTNIWAALEYVLSRYGKRKFVYWNRGYNQGY